MAEVGPEIARRGEGVGGGSVKVEVMMAKVEMKVAEEVEVGGRWWYRRWRKNGGMVDVNGAVVGDKCGGSGGDGVAGSEGLAGEDGGGGGVLKSFSDIVFRI